MPNNPYRVGPSVGGSESFVGRVDVLKHIKDVIQDKRIDASNTLLVWGQRRIGKSSILQELKSQLSNDTVAIIDFNWQERQQNPLQKVLIELTKILSIEFKQEKKPDLEEETIPTFQNWLTELAQIQPIVFLMDEFDTIATVESKREIIQFLEGLISLNPQHIKWIFVIGCKVEDLTSTAKQQLFGKMNSSLISYFSEEETQKLIALSESEHNETLHWPKQANSIIWQWTSGHPYFVQSLCFEVWEHCHKYSSLKFTLESLKVAKRKTLERSHLVLESLWDISLSSMERVLASALAQGKEHRELIALLEKISDKLEKARNSLLKWELIDKDNHFQVQIIQEWVKRNKSDFYSELEQIDDYAKEIYSVANRCQEEYPENAKKLLEQVIDFNPYHTQAALLLAKLWEKDDIKKTENILRKLYDYNPETTREPLVEILLKQVGQIEEQIDKAEVEQKFSVKRWMIKSKSTDNEERKLELYQEVLKIDSDNSRAGKGKRDIEEQRKSRALRQKIKDWLITPMAQIALVFLLALGISSIFNSNEFPPDITFEVAQQKERYTLTAIPSSDESIQLEFIKFSFDMGSLKLLDFSYNGYEKNLPLNNINKDFTVDKQFLLDNFPKLEAKKIIYPSKNRQFDFQFELTFSEKIRQPINFKCKVKAIDQRKIDCGVKQYGFFSIFRAIPWLGQVFIIWLLSIVVILSIHAFRNREKDDVY